jgi:hypothetical protein
MSKFADIMDTIGNDAHLPIGLIVFLVGASIHTWHGLDTSFVTFTTTILGFLGAHMYTQTKYPDQSTSTANSAWSSTTNYTVGQTANFSGTNYVATANNVGQTPPAACWVAVQPS